MKYNILVKIFDDKGIYLITSSIIRKNLTILRGESSNLFIKNLDDDDFNYLEKVIEGEARSLEELREEMEGRIIEGEFGGKYKIISGGMEEIIGEIRGILLLKEII
jgi:hypothetical protein